MTCMCLVPQSRAQQGCNHLPWFRHPWLPAPAMGSTASWRCRARCLLLALVGLCSGSILYQTATCRLFSISFLQLTDARGGGKVHRQVVAGRALEGVSSRDRRLLGGTATHMVLGGLTLAAGLHGCTSGKRPSATARHGLKDRVKKDFSTKSAMIKKLGKMVLQKEFDMRKQLMEDPMLAQRSGMSQEDLIKEFDRARDYLKQSLGINHMEAEICISKVATGLYMQHLGAPAIPSNAEMDTIFAWLLNNLKVSREDGTLRTVVEKYPFVLGRTIEQLEESRRFCPPDIDYNVAVAEDPALVDKTYNCDGICANMCTACWYNG